MSALRRHWPRIALTLLPVLLALLHATGVWRLGVIQHLDHLIYDARLRATMPGTPDTRVVIVDVDDASLAREGQWPWPRDKIASLTTELLARQHAAVLGFDVMFLEPDRSSGLGRLREIAAGPLRDVPGLAAEIDQLAPTLDHDATLAQALRGQPVALGYYFTRTEQPSAKGLLPATPALPPDAFPAHAAFVTLWNGFGASLPVLARAAPVAGFLNTLVGDDGDDDGVIRSVPLIARYEGEHASPGHYESLALAVYRIANGSPPVRTVLVAGDGNFPRLQALVLGSLRIPVDQTASMQVPFRGPGGPRAGSFRYVAAADVLEGRLAPGELKGKIVLLGATAPGLQDLRATPVGAAFPGVEVHANIVSGLLDQRLLAVPDYAPGYEVLTVLAAGLLLAFGLSLLSASRAVLLGAGVVAALVGLNTWLYIGHNLVLPLASALVMVALAFALNMSWGYFVESRARRGLVRLFGTYVPPQLVDEMLVRPGRYSMRAESKEMTVMFCDMRGFTRLSEQMTPAELQAFLNTVFSQLTEVISANRGTVDKYMGDCVMAFWGAPMDAPDHAALAVQAALDMANVVQDINALHRANGRPEISVGIGLNSGLMSVGDMGSTARRSYTVVGDAVNLASRLEGLSGHYGVEIVASGATREAAPGFAWQELDSVRVKGKAQAVAVYTPLTPEAAAAAQQDGMLARWGQVLAAYRQQDWALGRNLLAPLLAGDAKKVLYQLYAQRLASMALRPQDPDWDGSTRFDTK
ncbi:CHASE2 domain-containing protein [Acidovorax cavernicola]|uniref:Adenylate/guanylate cyclase domain-containing protein n=1 Tax=Acidovorax cavernicola TaxID=1675792 RepID=A0A9X8D5G2_9BURK|nr:adenylate/guanylate cyclase domain-containing protein [Acidovorax cavernicola]RIX80571.1 adenylate/guanylate cyclase domain-containing protein [Acidovorax cavernicola]